jgi:hypothetical protein
MQYVLNNVIINKAKVLFPHACRKFGKKNILNL